MSNDTTQRCSKCCNPRGNEVHRPDLCDACWGEHYLPPTGMEGERIEDVRNRLAALPDGGHEAWDVFAGHAADDMAWLLAQLDAQRAESQQRNDTTQQQAVQRLEPLWTADKLLNRAWTLREEKGLDGYSALLTACGEMRNEYEDARNFVVAETVTEFNAYRRESQQRIDAYADRVWQAEGKSAQLRALVADALRLIEATTQAMTSNQLVQVIGRGAWLLTAKATLEATPEPDEATATTADLIGQLVSVKAERNAWKERAEKAEALLGAYRVLFGGGLIRTYFVEHNKDWPKIKTANQNEWIHECIKTLIGTAMLSGAFADENVSNEAVREVCEQLEVDFSKIVEDSFGV
jgi:hypothetical protein